MPHFRGIFRYKKEPLIFTGAVLLLLLSVNRKLRKIPCIEICKKYIFINANLNTYSIG